MLYVVAIRLLLSPIIKNEYMETITSDRSALLRLLLLNSVKLLPSWGKEEGGGEGMKWKDLGTHQSTKM